MSRREIGTFTADVVVTGALPLKSANPLSSNIARTYVDEADTIDAKPRKEE